MTHLTGNAKLYGISWEFALKELQADIDEANKALADGEGKTVLTVCQANISNSLDACNTEWKRFFEALIQAQEDASSFLITHNAGVASAKLIIKQVARGIDQVTAAGTGSTQTPAPPNPRTGLSFKLPEIKLPTFEGEVDKWPQFWELFSSLIDKKPDIPVTAKFTYLKNALKGNSAKLIEGFTVTDHNYDEAKQLLIKAYDNKDRAKRKLVSQLLQLPSPTFSCESVREFYVLYSQILRSLSTYEQVDGSKWFFVEMLLSKLPMDAQQFIFHFLKVQYFGFDDFDRAVTVMIDYLENEVETNRKIKSHERGKTLCQHTATSSPQSSCQFCEEAHPSSRCPTYVSVEQRKQKLMIDRRCFKCGKKGHYASECRTYLSCHNCKGRHWTPLCLGNNNARRGGLSNNSSRTNSNQMPSINSAQIATTSGATGKSTPRVTKPRASKSPNENIEGTSGSSVTVSKSVVTKCSGRSGVALPTAIVKVFPKHKGGTIVRVRSFIDTGSQKSFVHPSVLKKLGLRAQETTNIQLSTFGQQPEEVTCPVVTLGIGLGKKCFRMTFLVTEKVETVLCSPGLEATVNKLLDKGLSLADREAKDRLDDIEMVIGSDHAGKIITGAKYIEGINLLQSPGGYLVYGVVDQPVSSNHVSEVNNCSVHVSKVFIGDREILTQNVGEIAKPDLSTLWNLETIGIKDENHTPSERNAIDNFQERIKYVGKQYWVGLPWKEPKGNIPTNFRMAVGQVRNLYEGLKKDPEKLMHYHKVIDEYQEKGFIEEVPDNVIKGHYLPHHAVMKDSLTTPLRVVFNASAKANKQSRSLNEALETGPSLTEKLIDRLVIARFGEFMLTADISKAFLRVGLLEEDRDYVRFLWIEKDNEKLRTFRFRSVLFGSTSSPFLLQATLIKHFESCDSPWREMFTRGFYVDNFLTTTDEEGQLPVIKKQLTDILGKANMPLQEWNSNSNSFNQQVDDPERKESPCILGIVWNTSKDMIWVKSVVAKSPASLTKRAALSLHSQVYDPLGLVGPITVKGKMFLSEMWELKIGWDEELPEPLVREFQQLVLDYQQLHTIKLERKCSRKVGMERLHVFCDASKKAYGAVAYITSPEGTKLLMSRSRIAPKRCKTIPELELTALLVGCRLAEYIVKVAELKPEVVLWSDSSVAIHWVQNNRSPKVYVQNRVGEILEIKSRLAFQVKFHLRHVESKQNPADLLSRGCSLKVLKDSSLWKVGPDWLKEPLKWPLNFTECINEILSQEANHPKVNPILEIENYSDLGKLLRVTENVFKVFKGRLEHLDASRYWIKIEQLKHYPLVQEALKTKSRENKYKESWKFIADLNLYLDEHDVICSKGRIENASLPNGSNNLVLLPPKSHLAKLLIRNCHERNYHVGVQDTLTEIRREFWLPHGRQSVKNNLNQCIKCKYNARKRFQYPGPPPLPTERVTFERPFQHTGVDLTGAIRVKGADKTEQKYYVILFTCLATRAVHLELLTSLSAESFIAGFRLFVARRSLPERMVSDNGTNFTAGARCLLQMFEDEEVKKFLGSRKCQWYFISPRAPWQGGVYERMVQIVKGSLLKAVNKRHMTKEELGVILAEVEAIVNNRPLTYVNSERKELETLTPAHLLYGRKVKLFPNVIVPPLDDHLVMNTDVLISYNNQLTNVVNKFTKLWANEYLSSLREKHYMSTDKVYKHPNVGDVVIVAQENDKTKWKLGKVLELVKGQDDVVREVWLECQNQRMRKTIDKLIPLELSESSDPPDNDTEVENPPVRPGRRAARIAAENRKKLIEEGLL